ncbi:MAG: type I-A CRISPR-associated protein Cas7/Csa2 [Pyrobaculum sp.]|jgi:CRISPR-associated protein Cst2
MRVAGPYFRVAGRFRVNAAVLTGAGTMGNYNMHATVRVVAEGGVYEVPALTGNALKHWHSVHAAEQYQALGGSNLNEYCMKGVGLRGKRLDGGDATNECEAIADFCNDLHGFLIPDKQIKRDSLVKFAFAVPVLTREELERSQKFAVTHNRVDPFQSSKETEMMVFKQEYSSARYGFSAALDLGLVLTPLYSDCDKNKPPVYKNKNAEKALRMRAAVLGLFSALGGGVGARAARALPIAHLDEVVVAVSKFPIPALVHGSYPDYVERSLDVLSAFAKIHGNGQTHSGAGGSNPASGAITVVCYGVNCSAAGGLNIVNVKSFSELVEVVLKVVDVVLS